MGQKADKKHEIEEVVREQRRAQVLELYLHGKTLRFIAKEVGISKSQAHNDLKHELAALKAKREDLAEGIMQAELERLDKLLDMLIRDLEKKIEISGYGDNTETEVIEKIDPVLANLIIKVMDRRAKYLGLNAPEKREHTGTLSLRDLLTQPPAPTPDPLSDRVSQQPAQN